MEGQHDSPAVRPALDDLPAVEHDDPLYPDDPLHPDDGRQPVCDEARRLSRLQRLVDRVVGVVLQCHVRPNERRVRHDNPYATDGDALLVPKRYRMFIPSRAAH